MKIDYDSDSDFAYISFSETGESDISIPIMGTFNSRKSGKTLILGLGAIQLDLNSDGKVIGLNIMGASKRLPGEILNSHQSIIQAA